MSSNEYFDKLFDWLLPIEGGYSNNPMDRGGPTKYGITQATLSKYYPDMRVRDLSISTAKSIYLHGYYLPVQTTSRQVTGMMFDWGVNCGVSRAVKSLQEVVGTTPDGIIGKKTLAAIDSYGPMLLPRLVHARMSYYANIITTSPSQAIFFESWSNRVAKMLDFLKEVK